MNISHKHNKGKKLPIMNIYYIILYKVKKNYSVKAKDILEKNALKKSKKVITKELLLGKGIQRTSEVLIILP